MGARVAAERNAEQIKTEIERARDELAGAVDQLSSRLDPKKLANDLKHTVRAKLTSPVGLAAVAGSTVLLTLLVVRNLRRSRQEA
jgi:hypothetical protein